MKAIVDRRKTGIPGSDATERVQEMGGPVAQRASRKQNQDGPVPLPIGKNTGSSRSRVQQDADDLPRPRQRRHLHGGVTLLLGAIVLIFLYLVIGWLYSAWVGVSNRFSYGPTPTSYLEAVVGDHDAPGHPTWFVAMNAHGTIVIQVAPGGDFTKVVTYVMSAQTTFHSWGNLDDIVTTLSMAGNGPAPNILVHLQGDPDIGHFYQRPSATFLLLNQQPGFKVGPFVDQ